MQEFVPAGPLGILVRHAVLDQHDRGHAVRVGMKHLPGGVAFNVEVPHHGHGGVSGIQPQRLPESPHHASQIPCPHEVSPLPHCLTDSSPGVMSLNR